ncbi:spermidine sinapoyl-CoA acyltransferase-like [Mercurialis annua]|uniref:spermidine sinapoyl-CoA acyltransferase-like n=1 Tax=Mercurialis annua TaxID=3986 RepID=UPI00215FD736|nr:spermidine sinapoyl-CoA acyltransferase-like [Mercurialis annua]
MATQLQNIPFLLEKKDVIIIKPAKSTPSEVLSFSAIDNDPNLEILCQTIYAYKANPISTNGNAHHHHPHHPDPASLIKTAISNALVHYYPLAGKLKRNVKGDRKLSMTCNGDGVPFLEATANCKLSSLNYLDGIDVQIAKQFVFDIASNSECGGYFPLVFQVTKFSCGGFTIGMGLSHSVADGFGAAQIFRAICEFASGKSEPTVKPIWERERLTTSKTTKNQPSKMIPIDNPFFGLAKSPYMPTNEIVHECFCIKSETIRNLKNNLMKECGNGDSKERETSTFTTVEVLGAYIWRSRVRAFKFNLEEKTLFSLTMGVRQLLTNPPLPSGYYGNAFVPSNVVLVGKKLNEGPLSDVVKLIKESKKKCANEEYIREHIEIMEKLVELNIKVEGGNGATMVLTDWRQLGLLEKEDFGWKDPVNIIPVPWAMFGYVDLCIFMPPSNLDPSMKGGVRVLVSLPKDVMPKFKEEMDGLLHLGNDS